MPNEWKAQQAEQVAEFEAEAAARTVDPARQKQVVAELWKLTRTGGETG